MVTILMMILVIGLDHLTKYMAISLKEGDIIIFDKFLKLTYLENRGAAFGILENKKIILMIFTLLIIGFVIVYIFKNYKSLVSFEKVIYGLLLGGALGNLIDRIFRGYVIDFISVRLPFNYDFPVFNVADIAVVVSCILLVIFSLKGQK
ncbi:MAG: signal peptidase II [Finegoldia magna]|uniref:Lipoprotein signal peptidase n=1 Tax=Finegoldia magna TaxID=1260 RepID=A0A233V4W6_FINMA|nr:signal peptidase II [Finegoldia magna]MDU2026010.1 signal peptidase II [Finegoldia magna]MDU5223247.1 signal peptidase II [Finegoldia magna]MDU5237719.1 signal peptidase II [Finegoldia magna]OXZ27438.1 signal peptidase II [Finegoldia magna]